MATSVLPTPVGPLNRNEPIGLSGRPSPERAILIAAASASIAGSWPNTTLFRSRSSVFSFERSSLETLAGGMRAIFATMSSTSGRVMVFFCLFLGRMRCAAPASSITSIALSGRCRSLMNLAELGGRLQRAERVLLVAPGMNERNVWGERIVLGSLARALPRAFPGVRVELVDATDVDRLAGRRVDLLVSMCTGPRHPWRADDVAARVDGVSVLWVVNHPDLLSDFAALPFDGFMTNSRRAVSVLGVTRPTAWSPLGVDPTTSLGASQRRYRADVVYLGSGGIGNKAPSTTHRYLDPAKRFDFALWGSNWSREYWSAAESRGEVSNLRNDWHRFWRGPLAIGDEAALYASATVVLGYHEDGQRAWGMWNNRAFEALAAGALLISDKAEGLAEEFGDAIVLTEGGDETGSLIERYLADDAERRRRASIGRDLVLACYTYDHAARRLRDFYLELCERRGIAPARTADAVASAVSRNVP